MSRRSILFSLGESLAGRSINHPEGGARRSPAAAIAAVVIGLVAATSLGAQVPRWRLSEQFSQCADEIHGPLGGVVEFSDGSTLMLEVETRQLRVVNWSTGTARLVGRSGRGPGEYSNPERLYSMHGDSALLYDWSLKKLLVANRGSVRNFATFANVTGAQRYLRGADSRGRFLAVAGYRFRWPGSAIEANGPLSSAESLIVVVGRLSGGKDDTIARIKGPTQRLVSTAMDVGAGRGVVPAMIANPLSGPDAVSLFPDGWVAIAYRENYRVDWIPPHGAPVRGGHIEQPVPLDDRGKSAAMTSLEKSIPRASSAMFDDWPATVPAFVSDRLIQSHDGMVLIQRYSVEGSRRTYDAIDRRGRRVGILETDASLSVLHVGQFGVLVLHTDADGVQHIRRYAGLIQR